MGRVCFSYLATDKTKFVPGMHNTYGNGIERAGWLARLARRLLVYNGICARATANFWGWYKAKKTGVGATYNGASHSIYRILPPTLFRFQLISFQPRWLRNWTEDEPNSYHLLANREQGGGRSGPVALHSQRWLRATQHVLRRSRHRSTMYRNYLLASYVWRQCVRAHARVRRRRARYIDLERDRLDWPSTLDSPTCARTIQPITSFPGEFRFCQGTISSLDFDAMFYSTCFVYSYSFSNL